MAPSNAQRICSRPDAWPVRLLRIYDAAAGAAAPVPGKEPAEAATILADVNRILGMLQAVCETSISHTTVPQTPVRRRRRAMSAGTPAS